MNIFVAKLNFRTESDDLRTAFEAFGVVDSAKVIFDRETGRSRGFGFVEMPNDDEGRAAIEALDQSDLDGSTIVVKEAEPRRQQQRPPRRDNYRRNDRYGNDNYYNKGRY